VFVLNKAYMNGFSTKSDIAREYADVVAIAAVSGLISTSIPRRGWGRTWRITEGGLRLIKKD